MIFPGMKKGLCKEMKYKRFFNICVHIAIFVHVGLTFSVTFPQDRDSWQQPASIFSTRKHFSIERISIFFDEKIPLEKIDWLQRKIIKGE